MDRRGEEGPACRWAPAFSVVLLLSERLRSRLEIHCILINDPYFGEFTFRILLWNGDLVGSKLYLPVIRQRFLILW